MIGTLKGLMRIASFNNLNLHFKYMDEKKYTIQSFDELINFLVK